MGKNSTPDLWDQTVEDLARDFESRGERRKASRVRKYHKQSVSRTRWWGLTRKELRERWGDKLRDMYRMEFEGMSRRDAAEKAGISISQVYELEGNPDKCWLPAEVLSDFLKALEGEMRQKQMQGQQQLVRLLPKAMKRLDKAFFSEDSAPSEAQLLKAIQMVIKEGGASMSASAGRPKMKELDPLPAEIDLEETLSKALPG